VHHRILVIDEDQAVASHLSQSINRSLDCEVHAAADLAEAMALLECYAYSLVVTDNSIGYGALRDLSLADDLAVTPLNSGLVAYSGRENANIRDISAGRETTLLDPVRMDEIRSALREALSDRQFVERYSARGHAAARLKEFLHEGGTRVYAQPIYRIDCNPPALVSVEFLTHGPVGTLFERPDVLFAYTRAAQTESCFDRHCIRRALAVAAHLPSYVHISVNVHASTLCAPPDFAEWFAQVAMEEGIDLRRLTLEIVEQSPAWNRTALLRALAAVRRLGVKIALDDIGLGHSNYQMVIDVRPDWLKIDRYFVHGCSTSQSRRAVIRSVARLAADLGAAVIAEGVEQLDDLYELKAQGIQLVQGFLLCPPKSVTEAFARILSDAGKPCSCARDGGSSDARCELRDLGLCLRDAPRQQSTPLPAPSLAASASPRSQMRA
jgi:EAL domain-containing protein (putative c-di-GMP-specific phosphodiesterase class I)